MRKMTSLLLAAGMTMALLSGLRRRYRSKRNHSSPDNGSRDQGGGDHRSSVQRS